MAGSQGFGAATRTSTAASDAGARPIEIGAPTRHFVCSNVHVCNLLHDNSNGTKLTGVKTAAFQNANMLGP